MMEIGTNGLPAYLYDTDDAVLTLVIYDERYWEIEDRVENLETVTSLLSLNFILNASS